ncbi:septum formation protein Maf [Oceanicola sp. 22II-s10i]|uniref:Maf family protein n=1 Tax=Oceanicola sp. 22II-s10i TaxID=1317116 RepID=UPI000B522107|nr:Maf family protein [Oceanicola sp. 22II-s10i]OWU85980.1 septum formation protein Maf [Oceanicola sp. 22II-s10i]
MAQGIVLASGSATRAGMLRNAGVPFTAITPRVDEEALRASLAVEEVSPRDMSDALAEMKALRVSQRQPGDLVIGSDQILALDRTVFAKAETREDARDTLRQLSGLRHSLLSAAVICEDGRPVWRHVTEVKLQMRTLTDSYIDSYLDRNWPAVQGAVGAYHVEGEGIRLFSAITGDYFAILGMPLLPLLNYLITRGLIDG